MGMTWNRQVLLIDGCTYELK